MYVKFVPYSLPDLIRRIVPKLEPEFKTDVLAEHAAFHTALEDLNTYILDVLGVEAGKTYGQTIPAPHKQKVPYEGKKLRSYLEALAGPLLTHVSTLLLRLDL